MPVDLISEDELRAALNPYRVDPEKFEATVRDRMNQDAGQVHDPFAMMPAWLQPAASLLPLEFFAGTAVKSAPIMGTLSKLLGFAALPAISVFVLLGSTFFGAAKIRKIQSQSPSEAMDEQAAQASKAQWLRSHRWGQILIYAASIAMAWFGATWLLFMGYIVSTLILLYILKSYARIGVGNRAVVGASCMTGLFLLGQVAGFAGIGDDAIHVLDQALLMPLFLAGALAVSFASGRGIQKRLPSGKNTAITVALLFVGAWVMRPTLWPATPARIRAYVESFDRAEFSSASWREWEIVATWAMKSQPAPDLSRPRQLLAKELANPDETLPGILNSALKVGLLRSDQVGQIKDYQERLRHLFEQPRSSRISPGWDDWVIRAAALRNDLTPEQRDYLEERLHATLKWSLTRDISRTLSETLSATQLLTVIGRPVDPAQYQKDVHELLRRMHSKTGGGFQRAGGFRSIDVEKIRVGEINATADAVELMEVYGIPRDLDINWVRSYLTPGVRLVAERWKAAAILDRLNHLPGVPRPSWYEVLYYERSFLAAVALIGLCIYATAISPVAPGNEQHA